MARHLIRAGLLLGSLVALPGPAPAQDAPAPAPRVADTSPHDPLVILADEVERLEKVVEAQRVELAQARLEAADAWRKLDELRQFIRDHEDLGRDFSQYQAVKAVAEREARMERAQAARQQREVERAEEARKREEARAQRDREQAASNRLNSYRDKGFVSLGFDVFLANMAFNYPATNGGPPARIDWTFATGHYLRLYPQAPGWGGGIDFSQMTISGSVLNASKQVRNIGVAVTFFDERGSQVGSEIIKVNNARPDVPYPFTSTVAMALNRAFSSASTHVLYADPVEQ